MSFKTIVVLNESISTEKFIDNVSTMFNCKLTDVLTRHIRQMQSFDAKLLSIEVEFFGRSFGNFFSLCFLWEEKRLEGMSMVH